MKGTLKIIAIIVAVFFIGYFLEETIDIVYSQDDKLKDQIEHNLEVLSELLSVFVSFSIFTMTLHAFGKSRDNHSLFLGVTFLIVGVLSLLHMLSYSFMPDFITPNSSHKSAVFLIESRLVLAIFSLVSVFIYKDTHSKLINKTTLLASAIVILVVSIYAGLFSHMSSLADYDPEDMHSTISIFFLSAITAGIASASYLYSKRVKETGLQNLLFLIYGFIAIIFSNLVYFLYEFSGHFLIIAGFYFVYLALYKSSVEMPYEKLALAEEKLRHAAEEKYKNLFDNANDAITTADIEGRVTSWNLSAEKIFGWKAQEVMGKNFLSFLVPQNQPVMRDLIVDSGASSGAVSGVDAVALHKDGRDIDVSMTVSPLRDANQNVTGVSAIFRDITERKKAEEIRRENERLMLANKAKNEFLTIMSHELRTPLNSIIGFSEILKQKKPGELNEKQEHYVNNVLTSGKHLLGLGNDVLDISNAEGGKIELTIEKIPVREIINEAIHTINGIAAKQNIALKTELDSQLEFIEADRQRFKQVLLNLLDNALKFSKKEGGTVTVAAKKEGDLAKISISDTGIGIRGEDMEKLFKEFVQLDSGISRHYGGTGLGLAISKKLVELQGGKITAESKFGEGSTFTFLLPLVAKKEQIK